MQSRKFQSPIWLLVVALVATTIVYWPGLRGPLLFDDYWNLTPVFQWSAGTGTWQTALLPNGESIIFSRPLAMASFMLSVTLGGLETTFPLKLGNLAIHLACGAMVWILCRLSLQRDPNLSRNSATLATFITAIWLLHPLHVSTVLYVVQRMTQLSAFCMLVALCLYFVARSRLDAGRASGWFFLFVLVPTLAFLGLLSKQNAVLVPFLCLVIELAYFERSRSTTPALAIFYGSAVALPVAAALTILAITPNKIVGGYSELEFTLFERVLTQPRVLFDYIAMLLVPRSSAMGLYTDDYLISTGLTSPQTTWVALTALILISIIAIKLRRTASTIFFGWFFFLFAHGVESSFLPIEMYYEHRNYLPSIGLFLAIAGAFELAFRGHAGRQARFRLGAPLILGIVLVLVISTFGRVLVWQNEDAMIRQGLAHHPDSIRLRIDGAAQALRKEDREEAISILTPMLDHASPRHRLVGRMNLLAIACDSGTNVDPNELSLVRNDASPEVTVSEVSAAIFLEKVTRFKKCEGISVGDIGGALRAIAETASAQPESAVNKSTIRRISAQLFARDGEWNEAERQAEISWGATSEKASASLLARAQIKNRKFALAGETITKLRSSIRPHEDQWLREADNLGDMLSSAMSAQIEPPLQNNAQ